MFSLHTNDNFAKLILVKILHIAILILHRVEQRVRGTLSCITINDTVEFTKLAKHLPDRCAYERTRTSRG